MDKGKGVLKGLRRAGIFEMGGARWTRHTLLKGSPSPRRCGLSSFKSPKVYYTYARSRRNNSKDIFTRWNLERGCCSSLSLSPLFFLFSLSARASALYNPFFSLFSRGARRSCDEIGIRRKSVAAGERARKSK